MFSNMSVVDYDSRYDRCQVEYADEYGEYSLSVTYRINENNRGYCVEIYASDPVFSYSYSDSRFNSSSKIENILGYPLLFAIERMPYMDTIPDSLPDNLRDIFYITRPLNEYLGELL